MNARSHRHAALSRLALAGAFLLTGLAGTARAAASIPLADAGGPGGSTQTGMLDETERSTNLIALTDGAPTGMLDETERSTDLIALSPHDAPTTAIDTTAARRGQPF